MPTFDYSPVLSLWLGFWVLVGATLCLLIKYGSRANPWGPVFWFIGGLACAAVVYPIYEFAWFGAVLVEPSDAPGADAATMFMGVYLQEYVISFDVVMVTALVCRALELDASCYPRVLSFAVVAAVIDRAVLLGAASHVLGVLMWTSYLLALYVLGSALHAFRHTDLGEDGAGHLRLAKWLLRTRRADADLQVRALAVRTDGGWVLSRVGVAVTAIIVSDLFFAFDSLATLSTSRTAFVVVSAVTFATISLRSWFFWLVSAKRLGSPRLATVALLALAAMRMLSHGRIGVSPVQWLALTGAVSALAAWQLLPKGR